MIEWLMAGDPALRRLVAKYLLDDPLPYTEEGMISRYLSAFDIEKGLWGDGVYGPKWISTHYTLRDLKYLEVDPQHPHYLKGLENLISGEWRALHEEKPHMNQDVCVVGMILSLALYANLQDERVGEMIDYLFSVQMEDGGWNCSWDSRHRPSKKSSLHTTLSVLEAFHDYEINGYTAHLDRILDLRKEGESFILRKSLFRSESTGEVIHDEFLKPHFPTRWKYDSLRALEYFARSRGPYDERMNEGMALLKGYLDKGPMPKGTTYSGKTHFPIEWTAEPSAIRGGRFNTFRALLVMKKYNKDFYEFLVSSNL